MKKIGFLVIFLSVAAYTASAQLYVRLGLGYAVPEAGQTLDGTGQPYNGSSINGVNNQSVNIKLASFSAGVQSSIGMGYMFSEHVGIQLDMNIGLATKKYTFTQDSVLIQGVENNYSVVQKAKTPVFLTPSLVLQTGDENKLNLYSRFGIVLPLSTKITQDQLEDNLPGTGAPVDVDFTFQIKNSFSVGFAAAAGVKYKINDRISVWGEANLLSMSVFIKESDVEALTVNGSSQSLSLVQGPLVVKYSKNTIIDSVRQIAYSQPFSNVGINVGVTFNLSEKKHSHHSGRKKDEDIDDSEESEKEEQVDIIPEEEEQVIAK